jgi:hypothetical protein
MNWGTPVEATIKCLDCGELFTVQARSHRDMTTVLSIAHRCACCAVAEWIEKLACFALKKETPEPPRWV